jgi:uncharacterized membrane protein
MNQKTKGYILGTIAAATYGMNPLFALPLYKDGMNPESVLFFRYLLAIPILAVMIHARGRSFRVNRKETLTLIVMGLLVAVSSLTLFQSYNFMEAGIASTILFVYPIMVAVIMALAFKEKISLQTGICYWRSGRLGSLQSALPLAAASSAAVSAASASGFIINSVCPLSSRCFVICPYASMPNVITRAMMASISTLST